MHKVIVGRGKVGAPVPLTPVYASPVTGTTVTPITFDDPLNVILGSLVVGLRP